MIPAPTILLLFALVAFFSGVPLALLSRRAAYGASLLGAVLLLAAAILVLVGVPTAPLLWAGPLGEQESVGLDSLSAFFAVIAAVVWIFASAFSLGYGLTYSRALAAMFALTLGSIALILAAGGSILFLIAWEGMTLASYGMILQARGKASRIFPAAFIFIAFGEASSLFVLLSLAGLRVASGSFNLAPVAVDGALADGIFLAAVVGFGLKMGVAPFHMSEWLPIAHSSAPSNASAVLSATLTLAGAYGLFRVLALLPAGPDWWGALIIAIGAISALLGALFASVSEHAKGLPAYSTIENNGLLLVAFGVAVVARADALPVLFAFALYAALYQAFAHALAKGTLFLFSGYLDRVNRTLDLNAQSSRGKDPRSPAFPASLAAALSLAAAPPFAGFVSEWMILESLFQSFRFTSSGLRFVGLLAGAAVALAAGLVTVAMVKFVGFASLWRSAHRGHPVRPFGLGAVLLGMAAVVLFLGVAAPWVLAVEGPAVAGFGGSGLSVPVGGALSVPDGWLILSGAPFGVLAPTVVVLSLLVGSGVGTGYLMLHGRPRWRRSAVWAAGNAPLPPKELYGSFSFSTGLRIMLKGVLRTKETKTPVGPYLVASVQTPETYDVELEALDLFKTFYDGLYRIGSRFSEFLKRRLMHGRLDWYIAYVLVATVLILVVSAWVV